MSTCESSGEIIPEESEACYETVASQEEIYLEEVEEELRAILIFGDPSPSQATSDSRNDLQVTENLDEQLNHAVEVLITGDSDDPPLSEGVVAEMLRIAQTPKGSARICEV
jgi:hypothetical protein